MHSTTRPSAAPGAPPLSVVMPVHNGVPFVEESVRSILAQSFGDFELVIGDDGSDDGSHAVLARLAAEDGRIRLLRRERRSGLAASANWIVLEARAPLVAVAHADDRAHPERLRKQVEVLRANPRVVLVGTLAEGIDASGEVVHPPNLWRLAGASSHAPFAHSSIMFRRASFHLAGGYRPAAEFWEDLDLYWRMHRTGEIMVIPEVLSSYRHSAVSIRSRDSAAQVERALELMYRCTSLYERNLPYDHLLESGQAEERPLRPYVFVARSWTRVWDGRRPGLLLRMVRNADLKLNGDSLKALGLVVWATISPRSLRYMLRRFLEARNHAVRRGLRGQSAVTWRPWRA